MTDLLNMDKLNSLPQPLWIRGWPVYDIDVQTGLYRVDVCGKLDVCKWGSVITFKDAYGNIHDPEDFYMDEPNDNYHD